MSEQLLIPLAVAVSALLTYLVLRHSERAGIVDVPNERSSHTAPTPRGGGIAIVIVVLASYVYTGAASVAGIPGHLAIAIGSALIALVGYVDDRVNVSSRIRFLVQVIGAAIVVFTLASAGVEPLFGASGAIAVASLPVAVVYIVWMTNLFNFMDGIDGIAAAEAAFIGTAMSVILMRTGPDTARGFIVIYQLLAAGCIGFLVFNWPPARIFMGDVGSAFLGFVIAAMSIAAAAAAAAPIWTTLILAGVFIVDATITLFARLLTGQRWFEAHRSHAYQHLAVSLGSHRKVTLATLAINVVWLLPIAWYAAVNPAHGIWLTLVAWLPLALLALSFRAGRPALPQGDANHDN